MSRQIARDAATERGSAMIITLMVMALVGVLTTTVLSVSVNNLGSARRAQDAASALDAADAGVAQALAYLRRSGVRGVACAPTCPANAWGNQASPQTVTVPGAAGRSYRVWIEPVAPFPTNNPGRYRVHSVGLAGQGVRAVEVDVSLGTGTSSVLGVFARSVDGGGSASVTRQSIFTTGCVYNRDNIAMSGIDEAYNIPVGVHSAQYISTSNGNNQNCAVSNGAIHKNGVCNTSYPHDQDLQGGSLLSTSCSPTQTGYPTYYAPRDLDGNGSTDVTGSWIRDDASLRRLFGISAQPFTASQLDDLRATARRQGTYYTSATGWASPNPATNPHAVLYFDLSAANLGGLVDLNDLTGWGRPVNLDASSAQCLDRSLTIVITGGNARINSNTSMAASLVLTSGAPYGEVVKANGTATFIGTIYADTVNLVGNFDVSLDKCFLASMGPSLLTATVSEYAEIDR